MGANKESKGWNSPAVRGGAAVVLIICSLAWGWTTYSKYTRGLPPKPQRPLVMPTPGPQSAAAARPTPDLRPVMPTKEERIQIMNSMLGKVSVSGDQRKELEKIWINGPQSIDGLSQRIADSRKVLTEQQAAALAPMFIATVAYRVQRASRLMKPQDFSALNRRLQGMMQRPALNPLAKAGPAK